MKLVACRAFTYCGAPIAPGDEFEASERDGRMFVGMGHALEQTERQFEDRPRKRSPIAARPPGARVRRAH